MGAAGSRDGSAGLTKAEQDRLRRRFERHAGKSGRLSLLELQRTPELSGNFFATRIFQRADRDQDGFLGLADFTATMDGLGRLGTEEEKLQFAFELCDLDGDGLISHADLSSVLQRTGRSAVNAEQLEKTVTSLIQEFDVDGDGRLSFPEFWQLAASGGQEGRTTS